MQAWQQRCRSRLSSLAIGPPKLIQYRGRHDAKSLPSRKGLGGLWRGFPARGKREKGSLDDDLSKRSLGKISSGAFNNGIRERTFDRDYLRIVEPALKTFSSGQSCLVDNKQPTSKVLELYEQDIYRSLKLPSVQRTREGNALFNTLRNAFVTQGQNGLAKALKNEFDGYVRTARITPGELQLHKKLADLRFPAEWWPQSRSLQRTIHLHVGPTNSGKTYQALKRLEQAETGIYAGPLRLLAHEVYTRMNAKGKVCALITGDDIRLPDTSDSLQIKSCTVEMVPLDDITIDVAVIDEIQLMADVRRGWAWTQAFLGIKAREVHLCGEPRAVPLIQELAASVGDKLEIHEYERLSPLRIMSASLKGNLKNLRKGDCVVTFSRRQLHSLKREIEAITGKRCAIVYGSLPPETRAQQAELFNNPQNDYDYLVASDAIGMGLNLDIKRIIFETTFKYDNDNFGRLQIAQVKQIAGRAGRFRTAARDLRDAMDKSSKDGEMNLSTPENIGLVTTLHDLDLPFVQEAMKATAPPITSAGIHPPDELVKRFASYFPPSTPFRFILKRLYDSSTLHNRFFISDVEPHCKLADAIEDIRGLSIPDRYILTLCPVNLRDEGMVPVLKALARCVANRSGGSFLDILEFNLEVLDRPLSGERAYLEELEQLHRAIGVYCWLSFRFRSIFTSQAMAMYAKELVEKQIEGALSEFSANKKVRERLLFQRQREKERWVEAEKQAEALERQEQDKASVESDEASETEKITSIVEEGAVQADEAQEQQLDNNDAMDPYDNEEIIVPEEPQGEKAATQLDSEETTVSDEAYREEGVAASDEGKIVVPDTIHKEGHAVSAHG